MRSSINHHIRTDDRVRVKSGEARFWLDIEDVGIFVATPEKAYEIAEQFQELAYQMRQSQSESLATETVQ